MQIFHKKGKNNKKISGKGRRGHKSPYFPIFRKRGKLQLFDATLIWERILQVKKE